MEKLIRRQALENLALIPIAARRGRHLAIGFTKNYFTYTTGGAVNAGCPPRDERL